MTLNLEAIKAKSDLARTMTNGYTAIVEVGDLNFVEMVSYLPALVAEVERLRQVEAAALALRDVMEADGVVGADEPCTVNLHAALDAAQGGG